MLASAPQVPNNAWLRQLGQAKRLRAQGAGYAHRRGDLSLKKDGQCLTAKRHQTDGTVADLADAAVSGNCACRRQNILMIPDVKQDALLALVGRVKALGFRNPNNRSADRHHLLPGRRLRLTCTRRQVAHHRRGDSSAVSTTWNLDDWERFASTCRAMNSLRPPSRSANIGVPASISTRGGTRCRSR